MRTRRSTLVPMVGTALLAATLTACSPPAQDAGADGGTAVATEVAEPSAEQPGGLGEIAAEHDRVDVAFAQQMIPHHEQAVVMSAMAEQRAGSDEVRRLAADIAAAQGPEIDLMRSMLQAWGEDPAGTGDMDMGTDGMPGMMSEEGMGGLDGSEGEVFDRMWLEGMVEHHEDAVEMATAQVRDGVNPQAVALAEQIAADQEAEIAVMEQLLAAL